MIEPDYEFPGPIEEEGASRPHGLRFGEGQYAYGGGRPSNSPNRITVIKRVARRRHRAKLDGRTCTLDTMHLVLRAVRTKAALGNIAAFDLQEDLKGRFQHTDAYSVPAVFFCPGKLTEDEWTAIYTPDRLDAESVLKRYPHLVKAVGQQLAYLEIRQETPLT